MKTRRRGRLGLAAALAACFAVGLTAAAGSGSGDRAAWTWPAPVPHQLAAAGGLRLLAAEQDGQLLVGSAAGAGGAPQLEPLSHAAGERPLVVYSAATPAGAQQQLVGVARADVDRVDATLADGRVQQLPLNEWRGFAYTAADAAAAATSVQAYSGGMPVGAVRLPQTAAQTQQAAPEPVYGLLRTSLAADTVAVARVDSRTLQPRGKRLSLRSRVTGPLALSPDGTTLALASVEPPRLLIVDLRTLRIVRSLPATATLRGLSWPTPDRLLELRQTMKGPYHRNVGRRTVVAVNPSNGVRVGAGAITNKLAVRGSVSTPEGLVLLLEPSNLRGPGAQLVLATPDGMALAVPIPITVKQGARQAAVLAADAARGHAYVVVSGGVVFDVDLATMSVVRHLVAPPAGAPTVPPPIGILQAHMLGSDIVAAGIFPGRGAPVAQGVALIDTATWTAGLVDASASRFAVLGDRLLTYGPSAPLSGHGLTLYDGNARRLAHLYGTRRFENVFLTPGFGHVLYDGKASALPRVGRRAGPVYVGPNDQLVFGLAQGKPLGGGPLSRARPPLGAPLLIFRGADAVGESGD